MYCKEVDHNYEMPNTVNVNAKMRFLKNTPY